MNKTHTVARYSALVLLGVIVILVGYSLVSPSSSIGYRTLLIDSKTHSYDEGKSFEYAGYKFKFEQSDSQYLADQSDCSGLIYGGLLGPNAKTATNPNQNWWPKEDCEKQNAENAAKSATQKYSIVSYSVTNETGKVMTLSGKWFTVIAEDGSTMYEADNGVTVAPHLTITKQMKRLVSSNAREQSIVVAVPGHATQVVNVSN